jgi:arylsulfatase A-like enzyme
VTFGSAPTDYSTDVLARRAVQFIRESRDAPFLVVLSLFAGHEPFTPAPRHAGRLAGLAPARPPSFLEPDVGGKPGWVRFLKGIGASPDRIDATRVAQLETLLAADEAVARVVDALDGFGLTDHTAVFFTSDNGIHWGEHWWTSKFSGYEESLRVPLLVRYPLLVPLPAASPALALNIDLAPTFADLARVQPMTTVDGESLRRVLEGEPSQRQDFLFESFDDFVVTSMRGVRDARYKLLVTRPGTPSAFEELYDLEQDPYELHNRAGDPALAAVLARLRARLAELTGS